VKGWLRRQLATSVVVHTTTDQSIAGVLEGTARDGIILRAARFLDSGDAQVPLAGETFIPRERIQFVQVIPPEPF
jgi:hypothetical protein